MSEEEIIEGISKEEIIEGIKNYQLTKARNSMGCMEDWYSFIYAMKQTFTIEEIEKMSQAEIDNLYKLADNIQEGLY